MKSTSQSEGMHVDRAGDGNDASQVMVLVDLDFFLQEYEAAREFYNDLYPDGEGSSVDEAFPVSVGASRLLRALSHFYDFDTAQPELVVFASERGYSQDAFKNDLGVRVEFVKGVKTYAMLETLVEQETFDGAILVADAPGYDLLLQVLLAREVNLLLVRHRQEEDHDASHMPTDIRYQYADYIAGLTLGLTIDEL